MGVEPKKRGKTHQIIHLFIGFLIIFTIHFGGFPPIFGNTHMLHGTGKSIYLQFTKENNSPFIVGKYTVPFPWILWIYGKF